MNETADESIDEKSEMPDEEDAESIEMEENEAPERVVASKTRASDSWLRGSEQMGAKQGPRAASW